MEFHHFPFHGLGIGVTLRCREDLLQALVISFLLSGFLIRRLLKSSVVTNEKYAFVGSDDGTVFAVDLKNGKQTWKFKTEMAVEAPPLVYDGVVYAGSTDGFVYAINAASGKLLWKYETQGEIMAANQAFRPETKDSVIIFGSYDNYVYCLESKTGKKLWSFETQNYVNGVPTVFDEKYVVFEDATPCFMSLASEDGTQVRSVEVEAPIAASVAVFDGIGYVGNMDRSVMAFNLTSGEQVWSYSPKSFPYFSSPALTFDMVYIGGRDKGLHAIDRMSGKQKGDFLQGKN